MNLERGINRADLQRAKLKHLAEPVARPAGDYSSPDVKQWRDAQSSELERLKNEIPSKGARDACVIFESRIKNALARGELNEREALLLIIHIYKMARKVEVEASAPKGTPPTPGPNYPKEIQINRKKLKKGVEKLLDQQLKIPESLKNHILGRSEVQQQPDGELKLRNIDLSPEAIKEKFSQDPQAIEKLKKLLKENQGGGKEMLQQAIEQVIKERFTGVQLTQEQLQKLEIQAPALALQVTGDLVRAMQEALDFEAKQETGFFQRLYARMTKRLTTSIALTIVTGLGVAALAPVVFPSLAGASLGLALGVGGIAGAARAVVGVGTKLFARHKAGTKLFARNKEERKEMARAVEEMDRRELAAKEQKMIDKARVKILEAGVKQSNGTRKEFLTLDSVSNIATNAIRTRTSVDFVELKVAKKDGKQEIVHCVLNPETGKLENDALKVLYKNIRDFVEQDPRFADMSPEQRKQEAKLLFSLYARKLTQREELIGLMEKQGGDPAMIELLKKYQKLMGGDISLLLGVKDADDTAWGANWHVIGSTVIGAGARFAYQNRWASGGALAIGGAVLGYTWGKEREERDILIEYHKQVEKLVADGEKRIKDIITKGDIMSSDIEAVLEPNIRKLRVLLSLNKAEGIPLIQNAVIRQRAEGMIHQFEKLKQEAHRKQVLPPEVEKDSEGKIRKHETVTVEGKTYEAIENNFSGRMRRLARVQAQDQQELAQQVREHVEDVKKKREVQKWLMTAAGAIGGFIGGYWGRDVFGRKEPTEGSGGGSSEVSKPDSTAVEYGVAKPESAFVDTARVTPGQPADSSNIFESSGVGIKQPIQPEQVPVSTTEAAPSPTEQVEYTPDALVHKGQGVEHVLIRQVKANPEAYGLPANASLKQIQDYAHVLAIKEGYFQGKYMDYFHQAEAQMPNETDLMKVNARALLLAKQGGLRPEDFFTKEVRVRPIDEAAYVTQKSASGEISVVETDKAGQIHGKPEAVDEYEYLEKFGKGVGHKEVPQPEPKTFQEEVERQWTVAEDNPETVVDETKVRRQTMTTAQGKLHVEGKAEYTVKGPDGTEYKHQYESWLHNYYPDRAKEFGAKIFLHQLESKNPEVLSFLDTADGREFVAETIARELLDKELHEGGFLGLGGPDAADLVRYTKGFCQALNLNEEEAHIFVEYLRGDAKKLGPEMFARFMKEGHLNPELLRVGVKKEFLDILSSRELPQSGGWEPRYLTIDKQDRAGFLKKINDNSYEYWLRDGTQKIIDKNTALEAIS